MNTHQAIYAYCLVGRDRPAAWPKGLRDRAIHVLNEGAVGAAFSTIAQPFQPGIDDVKGHGAVCDAALAAGPILPLRFGSVLPTRNALRRFLADHRAAIAQAFTTIEGHVELGLRILGRPVPEPGIRPVSGAAYLQARSGVGRPAALRELHDTLCAVASDNHVETALAPGVLFKAAYLVPRDQVDRIRIVLGRHAVSDHWTVSLTGPWPPYHFVSLSGLAETRQAAA